MKNVVGFPDRAAMLDRRTGGAYVLNFKGGPPVTQKVEVDTGTPDAARSRSLETFATNLQVNVCEALLLQSVAFKATSDLPMTLEDLKDARFSLMIDGEMIVPDKAFTDHLEVGCRPIPNAGLDFSKPLLPLVANQIDGEEAIADSTFGYFIPNNSVIVVVVRKLPAGCGKIQIETELTAAFYTTAVCSARRG